MAGEDQGGISNVRAGFDPTRTALLRAAPVGIFLTDSEGLCTFVNDCWCELAGMDPSHALGEGWKAAIHPDDRERVATAWLAAAETNTPFDLEYRFKNLETGKTTWVLGRAKLLPREDLGQSAAYIGTLTDISLHKKSEEAIDEANTFLDSVIENLPQMVFIKEAQNLSFVRFNKAGEELLGMSRKDLIGKNDYDFFPPEQAEFFVQNDREVLRSGTLHLIPEEPIDTLKNGRRFLRTRNIAMRSPGGQTEYLLGISEDITIEKLALDELHKSEARFKKMADSTPVLIWMSSTDGLRSYFNRAWLEFRGARLEQELGDGWVKGVHSEDLERFLQTNDSAFEAGIPYVIDFRLRRFDGGYRWMREQANPLFTSNGVLEGYIGSCFDISDEKRAAYEMERAKLAAEEATRLKSQFLANMSHEIRTPMNAIIGIADLLLQEPLEKEQRECVETIASSGASLLGIINDILDYSKIEAGKLEFSPGDFSPVKLVQDVVRVFNPPCREKRLALKVAISESIPHQVRGDEIRVRQILTNLASNAIKFTPEGGTVVIHLTGKKSARGDAELTFAVEDTGVGISPDKQALIFEPFAQADPGITRQYGGTGLGLSIVRQLVTLMGGTLTIASEEGKGSLFSCTLQLPLAEDSQKVEAPRAGKQAQLDKVRVLLVEDNFINQKLATKILEKSGCVVSVASNGEAAIELRESGSFEIVLMDVQMPVMDGIAATKCIREWERTHAEPPIPIIAMTAHAMQGDRERCLEAGMNDYVSKPFDRISLIEKISALSSRTCRRMDEEEGV